LSQRPDDIGELKLRSAEFGIHADIQQTAAAENECPDKDDEPQIELLHQTRNNWEYQKLGEPDQYHGFAGLPGAVILDLLKISGKRNTEPYKLAPSKKFTAEAKPKFRIRSNRGLTTGVLLTSLRLSVVQVLFRNDSLPLIEQLAVSFECALQVVGIRLGRVCLSLSLGQLSLDQRYLRGRLHELGFGLQVAGAGFSQCHFVVARI
jgi:hypothetical protein